MKIFINKLFSDSSEVSHKRFISLGSFLILLEIVIMDQLGIETDSSLILTFAGLIGVSSSLSVGEKLIK